LLDAASAEADIDEELLESSGSVIHISHMSSDDLEVIKSDERVCCCSWTPCVDHPKCVTARICYIVLVEDLLLPYDAFIPSRREDVLFLLGSKNLAHASTHEAQVLSCQGVTELLLNPLAPIAFQGYGIAETFIASDFNNDVTQPSSTQSIPTPTKSPNTITSAVEQAQSSVASTICLSLLDKASDLEVFLQRNGIFYVLHHNFRIFSQI